jgi:hypothetical protein
MSITYGASLIVGCTEKELGVDRKTISDWCDSYKLHLFQPYFDAPTSSCIFGIPVFESEVFSYVELPEKYKLNEAISFAFANFLNVTGKVGKLYLTVNAS